MEQLTDDQKHRLLVVTGREQDKLVKEGLGSWRLRRPARGKPVKVFVPNWQGIALDEFHRFKLLIESCTPERRLEIVRSFAEFVDFVETLAITNPNQSLAS
jgi:hypothetical protein